MGLQVMALTKNMAHMSFAKAASFTTSCLHVVIERGVVAIVREVNACGCRSILESHTSHHGVVAGWPIGNLLYSWIAEETSDRACKHHFCGVYPVVALGLQVFTARKPQETLVCPHLEACLLWWLVLAAPPTVFVPSWDGRRTI